MSLIKQKQIENLISDLSTKALDSQVVKKVNHLSDVNPNTARLNLDVYSKSEILALLSGGSSGHIVATNTEKQSLTGLSLTDRIFVQNDGDGKWALYIVISITDGLGATSTFEKIADQDLFVNALSSDAIKISYESNANTNCFTDSHLNTLSNISVSSQVDLDQLVNTLTSTTTTAIAAHDQSINAQTIAQNAAIAASNAQTTADQALSQVSSSTGTLTQIKEQFTNLMGAANTEQIVSLSNPIAQGVTPLVYCNGVMITDGNFQSGTREVRYTLPYPLEISDVITIVYAY
jgi:hypothetical protein